MNLRSTINALAICGGLSMAATPVSAQMGPPNPDTNRDGKVTWPEYKAMSGEQLIEQLDKNNDGKIARGELKALLDKIKIFAGAGMVDRMMNRFDQDDQNKDGFITQSEAEAVAKVRFEAGDNNNDGWLSKPERQAMQKASRGGSSK